jgi:hypothetical protein
MQPDTDLFRFECDLSFSSPCDRKVAKLLANDFLHTYLNSEIQKTQNLVYQEQKATLPISHITWTSSKTDLIELIYAICESGCFGKVSLKRLVDYFENVFNVELGNPYHTYTELKERFNRTQFLDELKASLITKMDTDERK